MTEFMNFGAAGDFVWGERFVSDGSGFSANVDGC